MRKIVVLVCSFALLLLCAGWGSAAHRIVSERATRSFPPSMQFMQFWGNLLKEHCMDADYRKDTDPSEGARHYINLDSYPGFFSTGTIPHSWQEAVAAYGLSFVLDKGIVPWAIVTAYDTLVACFARHDYDKAVLVASDIGHYVADAHNPMHLTRNFDGQFTGQQGIHYRYETGMINRYDHLILFEGDSVQRITDVNEYVFSWVEENYHYVDSILLADLEAAQASGGTGSTLYYQLLWQQTGAFTTGLLRHASLTLATLIYNAWMDAGSPVFWPSGAEEQAIAGLRLFPVPAGSMVMAEFHLRDAMVVEPVIIDLHGRPLITCPALPFRTGLNRYSFRLDGLEPGIYLVTLKGEKSVSAVKLVVAE